MLVASLTAGFAIAGKIDAVGVSLVASLFFLLMSKAPLRDVLRGPTPSALQWFIAYIALSGLFLVPTLYRLTPPLILLASITMLPAIPVYLYAMRRRKEMHIRFEIPAMALLALAAPFAYTVSGGGDVLVMFSVFILTLLYYSGSSFRVRATPVSKSLRTGLAYYIAVLTAVFAFGLMGVIPKLAMGAFLPFFENVWRAVRPKREKISLLGRIEMAKVTVYLVFLIAAYRI